MGVVYAGCALLVVGNDIKLVGGREIATALKTNTSLTRLYLEGAVVAANKPSVTRRPRCRPTQGHRTTTPSVERAVVLPGRSLPHDR